MPRHRRRPKLSRLRRASNFSPQNIGSFDATSPCAAVSSLTFLSNNKSLGLLAPLARFGSTIRVSAAIDAAIRSGRIAPVVTRRDNINAGERVAISGGRRELVLDIAERLLPTLRAKYPERRWPTVHKRACRRPPTGVTALMAPSPRARASARRCFTSPQ